jgi:hypothetical protein
MASAPGVGGPGCPAEGPLKFDRVRAPSWAAISRMSRSAPTQARAEAQEAVLPEDPPMRPTY